MIPVFNISWVKDYVGRKADRQTDRQEMAHLRKMPPFVYLVMQVKTKPHKQTDSVITELEARVVILK